MPKNSKDDKIADRKKRKSSTPKKNKSPRRLKKNEQACEHENQIDLSRQLLARKTCSKPISRSKRSNKVSASKNNENAKPMPSLAELEKMFEDSDNENDGSKEPPSKQAIDISNDKIVLSPNTIQTIALQLMEKMSNISDINELVDELPSAPVVPHKKQKKRHEPNRLQVRENASTKFCKGDSWNTPSDDDQMAKVPKVLSTSTFNVRSDENSDVLKDIPMFENKNNDKKMESILCDDKNCYPPNTRPSSFSPLPSTSKDTKKISLNDELFSKSFTSNNSIANSADLDTSKNVEDSIDIEIIEEPIEIIVVNDSLPTNTSIKPIIDENNDDSVEIIEPVKNEKESSIIVIDEYSNCFGNYNTNNDVIEIIDVEDVDNLIAENKSIIEKYNKKNSIETVTMVNTCLSKINNIINELVNHDPVSIEQSVHSNTQNMDLDGQGDILLRNTDILILANNTNSNKCNNRNSYNRPKQVNTPKSLSTNPRDSPQPNNRFGECPICIESLKGKAIASTLCGHIFCMECIKQCIHTGGKKCPTCRKKLKGVGYHQIFL